MKLKKTHLYLLSLLSGLLLTFGWPANGLPFLLFIGFVPLLLIEEHIYNNKENFNNFSFFGYSYIAMFIWNLLTTYWIYFSTAFGAALAIICNAMFMALVLSFFHYSRRVLKHNSAYIIFIIFWITFEYLHLDWDLSWSWLNLGNGFANYPALVQWYEYTGAFGGTLWILLVNFMIFYTIKLFISKEKTLKSRLLFLAGCGDLILIPIITSVCIYYTYGNNGKPVNVVVVQPNIDPYNEKFGGMPSEKQIEKFLKLARLKTDNNTDLLIGPETAIPEGVWENELEVSRSIDSLKHFLKTHPQLSILIGMSSYKMFEKGEHISETARIYDVVDNDTLWIDAYNTAILLDTSLNIQVYHKSKLVPGVEKMPFPKLLKPLEKFAFDLGGTTGSLGVQDERSVLYSCDGIIKAAPVICYESIYGEYVSEYVKNGANIICIITNDGWWENTPGHKQHCNYARLRAVETRRDIARSANTGISCFINQRGDVSDATSWWKDDVIRKNLLLNEEKTFYVKYGDYIARTALYMSAVILFYIIFLSVSLRLKSIRKK